MGRIVTGAGRVVPAVVLDAREQARRLVEEARIEAAEAREEALAARERAWREGFEAGREAGQAELTETLVAARADAERQRAAARDAALPLAVAMAEKIVGEALRLDPGLLAGIAGRALEASRVRGGNVTLRLHPEDLAAVERERPRLAGRLGPGVQLCGLVPDETVGRHGCVVETPHGRVDARLSVQLDALERALRGDRA